MGEFWKSDLNAETDVVGDFASINNIGSRVTTTGQGKDNMKYIIKKISSILIVLHLSIAAAFAVDSVTFYHTDPAGTPIAMSDSSGTIVWKADYKPFGEEQLTVASQENIKMYVGKEKDKETGLYYFTSLDNS